MMWNDKRYHSLDYELKKIFGEKAIKLSIDGNFTCPNRDGKVGLRGCIFAAREAPEILQSGERQLPTRLRSKISHVK